MTHPSTLGLRPASRLATIGLLAALSAPAAFAQHAPPSFEAPMRYDSGPVANTSNGRSVVISTTVHVDGADWLRLSFRNVVLAGDPRNGDGSILRITSHKYGTSGHAGYQIYDLERIKADAAALMADPTTVLDSQDGEGLANTCELSFD